jgi:general secretion pathway protein N
MMLDILKRQPLTAALALTVLVLALVIGFETGFGSRLSPAIPAGPSKSAAPLDAKLMPPLAAANPDELYPETVARPLFVPLRRPAPPAEQVAATTMKRGQYVLQGVTIAGNLKIALLRDKATGRIHRVEKDHELNGMKLAEVSPESVTLAQGAEQEVLPLQVQKTHAGAAGEPAGPFGNGMPGAAPGAPIPGVPSPGSPNPLAPPPAPNTPHSQFGPMPANPQSAAVPQATTAPMSPEELLARRRARRAPNNPNE